MKHILEFETGETTCAVEPGKFCMFERTTNFGQRFICDLFDRDLFFEDGWLRRCPECLERFHSKQ